MMTMFILNVYWSNQKLAEAEAAKLEQHKASWLASLHTGAGAGGGVPA